MGNISVLEVYLSANLMTLCSNGVAAKCGNHTDVATKSIHHPVRKTYQKLLHFKNDQQAQASVSHETSTLELYW